MADTAKVIRLEPDVQRHVRARLARLPAAVHAFNESGKKILAEFLVRYFDSVDDALFELADRADSNQDQNLFFDSMREVRVQRKGIESRFMDTIQEAFARLVAQDDRDELKNSGELSAEALSLVQNEDLEQLVAVESTISKANRRYAREIRSAASALEAVVPGDVGEQSYPFGPQILCAAMMSQIKRLDIDIKAKLLLFELFDTLFIQQLSEFYAQILDVLSANGLNVLGGQAGIEVSDHTGQGVGANLSGNAALLDVLSFAQKLPVSAATESGVDLERVIASVQKHKGVQIEIGRIERETINMVHLMFRFILKDHELAQPLKLLVCRLQIPILRVALTDTGFLENKRHPARRLLNEFTSIALQWNSAAEIKPDDALFSFMSATVERILVSKTLDGSIFKEALADFSSFVEKERRRSAVLEKRTVDAEDGKARAEVARQKVADEIRWRTMAYHLPSVVQEMIDGPWSNVLFVCGLKYGFESAEWAEQLKVLTDLVWSVQPCSGKTDRQKLIRMIPELIKRLRRGLDAISYNPFEVSELFTGLEEVHLVRIRGGQLEEEMSESPPADISLEMLADEPVMSDLSSEELIEENPLESLDEPKMIEPDKEDLSSFLARVDGFSQGAWFDLNYGTDQVLRCRLAAFIKPTGKYIFVSRSGTKVAEKTRDDLALELRAGHLRTVDNSMLFDKALENVVSGLRQTKSGKPMDFD